MPPTGQIQAKPSLTLDTLPPEVFLTIVSFLPPSSIACLSLASKWYQDTLENQFDLKGQSKTTEKARFLRLLEEDLPEMIACYSCNILYHWKNTWAYLCPNHLVHASAPWGVLNAPNIYRNIVDVFLRGFAKGPQYGPQLHELPLLCTPNRGNDTEYSHGDAYMGIKSLDARVVEEKLLLHRVHEMSFSISAQPPDNSESETWRADFRENVERKIVPALDEFGKIGCVHTFNTMPAIVWLALRQLRGWGWHPSNCLTKSLVLMNCCYCATDIRVRLKYWTGCPGSCIHIEIEIWQCLGSRESDSRDKAEDAIFQFIGPLFCDLGRPPDRNLEKMFKEGGFEGGRPALCSPDQPQQRQYWMQLWRWNPATNPPGSYGFNAPGTESIRIEDEIVGTPCAPQ
ncbi:hypothetical protein AYL99_01719 [Fonsecaea erecta]|uniref:F-box domain-containing protein n=1 Tax=Fonsecaea erecta TaxID=1367422 RepID=A0A179A175_9EURO|nr:hypothetical protein AYL99_01719 [Fonsecaea erecta]OAP65747.1 hypothetical protein AYL99_01719 [Fonsecaea erecta]